MIFIYSFTILQCFLEEETQSICNSLFSKEFYNIKTFLYDFSDLNEKSYQKICSMEEIHLFIFSLDQNPNLITRFIKVLQNGKYSNYPMILFSKSKEYLFKAFLELKPFQSALLPTNKTIISKLTEYIQFYYDMYKASFKKTLQLNVSSCFYRIQIDNILFIEAKNRKVSICTKDNQITEIPIPFHHILKQIPKNTLIQSHRSYIINPNNVARIDKESKHWIVSFYNTDKKAFISRSYKQSALNIAFMHIHTENIIENYPMIDSYYFQ